MPNVGKVRPKIWKEDSVIDLYDDGEYLGYPNQGRNPVWYSEPQFLEKSLLHALLGKVISDKDIPRREEFMKNILIALDEC